MDSKRNQALSGVVVLVIIAVVVVAAVMLNKPSTNTAVATPTDAVKTNATSSSTVSDSSATYKDGTYTAAGSYTSPGGTEKINVTVTLKNGVIASTSAVSGAIDQEGQEFQSAFISGYQTQVVGKKVSEVKLSRVSGSSLTSQGFNAALTQIKSQAQS